MFCVLVTAAACAPRQQKPANSPNTGALPARAGETHAWGALTVEYLQLDNGLQVFLVIDRTAPVFAYQTWFDVGSANERAGITGIAHLFEHLMFKQTSTMEDGEFDRTLEALGARINASTWVDWTFYRNHVPAGHIDLVARLEADRMRNLVINDAQLNSERAVVINERRFRIDNSPTGTMYEALWALGFEKHPYQWPTVGWMSDLEQISLDDCKSFYETFYAPNNATLVIIGDVDRNETMTAIQKHYGEMKPQTIPEEAFAPEPAQAKERRRRLELSVDAGKLLLGYRQPSLMSGDHPAVEVLNAVLFDGDSSRLHRRLVTESGVATDLEGWVAPFKYDGLLEILVSLKPGQSSAAAEKIVVDELARVATQPIDDAELAKAKNRFETKFLQSMDTTEGRARVLGHWFVTTGGVEPVLTVVDRTRNVSAGDVQRVAAAMFDAKRRNVIEVVPEKK